VVEESKYSVKICDSEKRLKVSKAVVDSLKGVASGKMMRRMKNEFINCPVLSKDRPFLECYACSNFLRRFKGEVHCIGLPLDELSSAM